MSELDDSGQDALVEAVHFQPDEPGEGENVETNELSERVRVVFPLSFDNSWASVIPREEP